jgi:micrococcal nuclease
MARRVRPLAMRRLVLAVILCCLAAGCVGPLAAGDAATTDNATVTHVVDGDTIDVRFDDGRDERIRLLGIDTPEVHVETSPGEFEGVPNTTAARECLRAVGQNASRMVRTRIDGMLVRIETDPVADRRGGYDRLLAYVIADGTNLNRLLVAEGYARVYDTTFTERETFERAEARAMDEGRGVWRCRD